MENVTLNRKELEEFLAMVTESLEKNEVEYAKLALEVFSSEIKRDRD